MPSMSTTVRGFLGVVIFCTSVGGAAPTCTAPERSLAGGTLLIDIKPDTFPNGIYPRSTGTIPVAILTNTDFHAHTVHPKTVRFGTTGTEAPAVHSAFEDIDKDGDLDLLLHFRIQDTGIRCGDTSASLTGHTTSGQAIRGSDSIVTVGCM